MNYIDFLLDTLTTGSALGIRPGSTEETVESAWGSGFMEDVHKRRKMKRWDYGLAEFSFSRDPGWVCTGFTIQLHRLADHGNSIVPTTVSSIYGEFPKTVSLTTLTDELQRIGANLHEKETPGGGYDTYAIPEANSHLYVVQGEITAPGNGCGPGDIWSIAVP
jgi:hypothetical protein